jgi:hypothetical protein
MHPHYSAECSEGAQLQAAAGRSGIEQLPCFRQPVCPPTGCVAQPDRPEAAARAPGAEAAVLDYNWTRFARVVDVAGAYGSFLARLLRRNQRAAGVLFDQPLARARAARPAPDVRPWSVGHAA